MSDTYPSMNALPGTGANADPLLHAQGALSDIEADEQPDEQPTEADDKDDRL